MNAFSVLPQVIVSGLAAGILYALPALAFVLIYKTSDVMNFAQGEMAMFTTFIAFVVLEQKLPLAIAFLGALIFAALIGIITERVFLRPIEHAPVISKVIVTLGIDTILLGAAGLLFGYETHPFPTPVAGPPVRLAGLVVSRTNLLILGVAVVVMIAMYCFFKYTMAGVAMRATAENPTATRLMGVDINSVLSLTWAVSAMIGAVAGLLIAPINFLDPNYMFEFVVKAFAAAVLGGFTSLPGVVVGGLILGVLENLVGLYIATEWKTAFAFGLIVVVLAVRPTGLMGAPLVKKV